jgi:hypothetical protein
MKIWVHLGTRVGIFIASSFFDGNILFEFRKEL